MASALQREFIPMGKPIGDPKSLLALIATAMLSTSIVRAQPATDAQANAEADGATNPAPPAESGDAASVTPPSPREAGEPDGEADDPEVEATFSNEELTPQDYPAADGASATAPPPDKARNIVTPAGPEPEDVYLFVPRTALLLPRLVLDVVAFPIRGLATLVDKYHLIEQVKDVLYNDARNAAVVPTLGYQNDYGFTGGIKAFHNDVFGNDEELSGSAEYGGLY